MDKSGIKKSPYKIFIYYSIGTLLILCLVNCIGLIPSLSVQNLFLFILFGYLLVGILHVYLSGVILTALNARNSLLFTLLLTLVAFIVVYVLNRLVFNGTPHTFYTLGLIIFPLPSLFIYSLNLFLDIPERTYKKWYFPVDHTMPDLDLLDLSQVLIIQFELLKNLREMSSTNFKAKAPHKMPFGELFYIFINDYNASHQQNTIEVLDEQNRAFPWVFIIKTSWWKGPGYIDPDLTIRENGIANNDIIFCRRVKA